MDVVLLTTNCSACLASLTIPLVLEAPLRHLWLPSRTETETTYYIGRSYEGWDLGKAALAPQPLRIIPVSIAG